MYILALESSTTSAKAMLYNTQDGTQKVVSQAYRQRHAEPGLHDARDVFEQTAQLGRELAAGKEISMIALSGTWHSVMLCDEEMAPRTPLYHWTYTGAASLCKKLRKDESYVHNFYHRTGNMVNAVYPAFKLKLLAEQGYDLTQYRIAGQGTYNTFRLTGEWVVTDVVASGSGLLNIHTRDYDDIMLEELGISRSSLGRLVTWRDVFPLSGQGAELLGLKPGIPVIPTLSDGGLNQVGSGALQEGIMTFSVGTSGAIRLTTRKPVIPEKPGTWCYLAPDVWMSGAATSGCCNCVDWIRERIPGSQNLAELDRLASETTGSIPTFLPFLFGERCPGWDDDRNAAFLGITASHTGVELYRSVLEGTLFNLYQCYEVLQRINGAPKSIKLSGGILNSPFWQQMCADIFGVEMEAEKVPHASLAGAVTLARKHLGLISDLAQAGSTGTVIAPDPSAAPVYRERYARYLEHYSNTR